MDLSAVINEVCGFLKPVVDIVAYGVCIAYLGGPVKRWADAKYGKVHRPLFTKEETKKFRDYLP